MSFDNGIAWGQEHIKEFIDKSVTSGQLSHAYIICGENGSGKMDLAKLMAASMQCKNYFGKPCGECKSCKQMAGGNQPDVITLIKEKKSIRVDEIRDQINHTVDIKPYEGPYKIYIIPDADTMNEQAQNALLKTIEEPPQYAVLILLVQNVEKLLPTILSRCVQLNMRPVPERLITNYIMDRFHLPDYAAEKCAIFAQGNIGKAVRYASDDAFMELTGEVIRVVRSVKSKKIDELYTIVKRIKEEHYDIDDYLDLIILWYRDVLLYKAVKDATMLIFRDEVAYIAEDASRRSYENIEKCVAATNKAKIRLNANVNFDIAIELLLVSLAETW